MEAKNWQNIQKLAVGDWQVPTIVLTVGTCKQKQRECFRSHHSNVQNGPNGCHAEVGEEGVGQKVKVKITVLSPTTLCPLLVWSRVFSAQLIMLRNVCSPHWKLA